MESYQINHNNPVVLRKNQYINYCDYSLETDKKINVPQSSVSQNFNNIQRVEVRHKQVRFSVGWST